MSDNNENQAVRLPPYNVDAEKSVLCGTLMSREAVESAVGQLKPNDFHVNAHKDIFDAVTKLFNGNSPIDPITVSNELEKSGKLNSVGGMSYLMELAVFIPTAANVSYYIDIVLEHSVRRRLLRVGSDIAANALDTAKTTESTIADAERQIFDIAMNKSEDSLVHVQEPISSTYIKIGDLIRLQGKLSGITTGFSDLDKLTSGLQRSDLIILAARPSMGKTALALNIATNAAIKGNAAVAVFSIEMSADQLVMRILCSEAGISMQKVKTGNANKDELMKIAEVIGPLSKTNIYIDDTSDVGVSEIRAKCRRLKARFGLDLIVIDYLQLMKSESGKREESRVLEVGKITRSLKTLARELNVPIILLSQLSRAPELRKENPRPIMSDLRESGAIEQDADVIMMLYRPAVYGKSDDNTAELIFAKHRNGPTETVKLAWIPEYTKFTSASYGSYGE